jgi:transposase InsO family protein
MGPFLTSCGNKFILVAVDYISKWIKAIACPVVDSKVVKLLFKKVIFPQFSMSRVVISDDGSHFINRSFDNLLKKYGVKHKVAIAYHPHLSSQAEISNREIKKILEKVVGFTRKN